MNDDLKTYPCGKCGEKASEVIYAEKKTRVGWYCAKCSHFEKTIGREKKLADGGEA